MSKLVADVGQGYVGLSLATGALDAADHAFDTRHRCRGESVGLL